VNPTVLIIDTNVVVAGLLTSDENSPVAHILDAMLRATFRFVVSEALLAEYRMVLRRPALRKLHGLSITELDTVLTDLARHAIVLSPVQAESARAIVESGVQPETGKRGRGGGDFCWTI